MPESTSRHTSLDSFLPQFAPPVDAASGASAKLNGHGRSSPQVPSNGHTATNGRTVTNGHAVSNGHEVANGSNGFASLSGYSEANGHSEGHSETNGHVALNGHVDLAEQESDEQQIYLDDELPPGFEELQAAAVDSVHGDADLAESLLLVADPLAGALASEPLLPTNGRMLNGDSRAYESAAVAQIRETPADKAIVPEVVAELPLHGSDAAAGLSTAPSSNGAASPSSKASGVSARPELEAHPACGSLFVPYLVTEIPDLRCRRVRRSWWRRLLG